MDWTGELYTDLMGNALYVTDAVVSAAAAVSEAEGGRCFVIPG